MTTETTTGAKAGEVVPAGPKPISPAVLDVFDSMIDTVPDALSGDGLDNILAMIARAADAKGLDAAWRSSGLDEYDGMALVVTAIRKAPSDYEGGLDWFLIADAVVKSTGDVTTITTGSVSVVAQLVKAHALGLLPLTVVPVKSRRPTASGNYAWHLQVVG